MTGSAPFPEGYGSQGDNSQRFPCSFIYANSMQIAPEILTYDCYNVFLYFSLLQLA